jgi:hypothetical protein
VKRLCLLGMLVMLAGLVSCGGGSQPSTTTSSTSGIVVTVSPATVSVNAGSPTPTQFNVTLSGATNLIVTWMVNDTAGGDSTVGTIDSNGLYVPPAQVPGSGSVTIKAVSSEDSTASGTASVMILPPPQVTVSPTTATVVSGGQVKFTATVTGAATTNVNWTVTNNLGFIATDGTYTAPPSPPPGGSVTVTAASRDFPQSTASATVTINSFALVSLKGSYAFTLTGKNSAGTFFRAGSFTADGAGNLSGGIEDINDASGSIANPISFVGSYTLGPDGRGTMQFNDGQTPSTFRIVLVSNAQLQIIGFDGSGTASGQANLQNLADFGISGLFSTYVFDFTGLDSSSNALSRVGEFKADGHGNITGGHVDINDGGILSQASLTGVYTIDSSGRGTVTLSLSPGGDIHFAFYIVDSGAAKFVQTDSRAAAGAAAGVTTQQAPNLTFSLSSLNGNYAFLVAGAGPSGAVATAGQFSAAGNGNITSGMLDENVSGTVTSGIAISSGTYTVDSTGRGIATLTTTGKTYQFVFYLGPAGTLGTVKTAVVQETDSSITSDGLFVQQSGTFSAASVQISYALAISGLEGSSPLVMDGQLKSDGSAAISSGTLDLNTGGSLTPGEAASGSYTVNSNGRGTLTLNPSGDNRKFSIYVLSPSQIFVLGIDDGRLAAGALLRQF